AADIWATVGGGFNNIAQDSAVTISGGRNNGSNGRYATIGGGDDNAANGSWATVSGGFDNSASASWATVPGGFQNLASGQYAFAAGRLARAINTNSVVFSAGGDTTESFGNNTFTARAPGGVRFYTDVAATNIGASLAAGSGTWSALSDRNVKENFEAVDTRDILSKVAALDISRWNYKTQDDAIRHIGPMAQDFHAAFGVGENETTITTVDADGVLFAAVQELANRNETLEARVKLLEEVILQMSARTAP
ncbi:MAG: tail fiber domain-containing protein, partial [bacterium]|nr:tail fiber domain-containing protein [bacterium]